MIIQLIQTLTSFILMKHTVGTEALVNGILYLKKDKYLI